MNGLHSPATMLQLTGNVSVLMVPAALSVLLWPALGQPSRLALLATGTGAGIELVHWGLPLGRVVSPLDAVRNAAGATAAGLLVAQVHRSRHRLAA